VVRTTRSRTGRFAHQGPTAEVLGQHWHHQPFEGFSVSRGRPKPVKLSVLLVVSSPSHEKERQVSVLSPTDLRTNPVDHKVIPLHAGSLYLAMMVQVNLHMYPL
jgi:hypothetical protein